MALMKYVFEQNVTRLPKVTEELFGDFKEKCTSSNGKL